VARLCCWIRVVGRVGLEPQIEQLESEIRDAVEQAVQPGLVEFGRQDGHARTARYGDIVERRSQQLAGLTLDRQDVVSGHGAFSRIVGPRLVSDG